MGSGGQPEQHNDPENRESGKHVVSIHRFATPAWFSRSGWTAIVSSMQSYDEHDCNDRGAEDSWHAVQHMCHGARIVESLYSCERAAS
jgi:hypothetical protein